ncbi:procathepsin L-like [Erpetoichthys calabaricus]|uniref:procathepsin L-like n=1 Tax=Erpetoichthys calabaricus TaxID=27687 RepID=UPI0022346966|nr:procathepsin L-like [Erpetoichthys calabaricus]
MWEEFKYMYNKEYATERKEAYHRQIWERNLNDINKHNFRFTLGFETYTMRMNSMGDWETIEESSRDISGKLFHTPDNKKGFHIYNNTKLPISIDWIEKGYVTKVRSQGDCGSCWAFSALGALEGLIKKQINILVELSAQQLVDCSLLNNGCQGGTVTDAFKYVINRGISLESNYHYTGKVASCSRIPKNQLFPCSGYVKIPFGDEMALQDALANIGPISVSIDTSPKGFQFYHSGIYYNKDCSTRPDHCALLVGYGTYDGEDYWIVKNSWGEDFGEGGYILIARHKNNHCGIASRAIYPV